MSNNEEERCRTCKHLIKYDGTHGFNPISNAGWCSLLKRLRYAQVPRKCDSYSIYDYFKTSNNEEERRKLATDIGLAIHGGLREHDAPLSGSTMAAYNAIIGVDPGVWETICFEAADRVIKYYEGWKSPLDCNTCIDESAQRVSDTIQQAREEERKEIGSWLDCQNSWKHNRLVTERQIESLKQGKTPFERKYISGKTLKGE